MTKAWQYLTGRLSRSAFGAILFFSAAGVATTGVVHAESIDFRFEAATFPQPDPQTFLPPGTLLFSGSFTLTGSFGVGDTVNLYTSAADASGLEFGVLNFSSGVSPVAYFSSCINDYPGGTCFNKGTPNPVIGAGTLESNVSKIAGTAIKTANGWSITSVAFGITTDGPGFYYFESAPGGATYAADMHSATVASGSGDTTRYAAGSAGGTPIVQLDILPEIDGGALARGALLLTCLFLMIRVRNSGVAGARSAED